MIQHPIQKPDIISQEAGDETILYRVESQTIHVLNPTARHIWELCDGRHTPADIARSLRAAFDGVSPEFDLEASVRHTLAELAEKQLLQATT
ncbi:MAG: hypothetical protein FOGNACKC_03176 [Anaerolineae bacterium]|nr:hypothetical protein [Anaerolineae bacterium]